MLALSGVDVLEGRTLEAEAQAKQAIQLARSNGMEYQATGGLALLGEAFLARKDESKAEEYYQQSLELARRNNGNLNEAIALLKLANLRQSQRRTDDVFAYLEQALPFLRRGKYRKWLSHAMQIQGRAYRDRGDYDAALNSFGEQLRLEQEVRDWSQVARLHAELGNLLVRQEKFEQALEHFRKAHELLSSSRDNSAIPYVVNNEAGVLWQLGRYAEAKAALRKATDMAGMNNYLRADNFVNSALLELSDWQFGRAEKHSRQALKLANQHVEWAHYARPTIITAQYTLGLAQVRSGLRQQAGKQNCETAVKIATSTGDPELIATATLALAEAMYKSGEAFQALNTVLGLMDKLATLSKPSSEWRAWGDCGLRKRAFGGHSNGT